MSSELQLDVRHLNKWMRHLVNAYEVRQAFCLLQVKLCDPCLSALKWYLPCKTLYKYSALPLLFNLNRPTERRMVEKTSPLGRVDTSPKVWDDEAPITLFPPKMERWFGLILPNDLWLATGNENILNWNALKCIRSPEGEAWALPRPSICEAGRFVARGEERWEAKQLGNWEREGGGKDGKKGTKGEREGRRMGGEGVRSGSTPLSLCNCILLLLEY